MVATVESARSGALPPQPAPEVQLETLDKQALVTLCKQLGITKLAGDGMRRDDDRVVSQIRSQSSGQDRRGSVFLGYPHFVVHRACWEIFAADLDRAADDENDMTRQPGAADEEHPGPVRH